MSFASRLRPLAVVLVLASGVAAGPPQVAAAERVVALGGAVTEIVFAVGRGDRLVGVDSTSTFPPEAALLPDVGYFRQVGAEGILSLAPDLVVATDGAGPEQALRAIAGAGVEILRAEGAHTPDGVAGRILAVSAAVDASEKGRALADRILADFAELAGRLDGVERRPTVVSAISISDQSLLAAGGATAADALIGLAGGRNPIDAFEGYRTIGSEALLALAPDFLLLPSHTVEALGGIDRLSSVAALRMAGLDDPARVIVIDTVFGLTFGPRQAEASAAVAHVLHPDRVPAPADTSLAGLGTGWR